MADLAKREDSEKLPTSRRSSSTDYAHVNMAGAAEDSDSLDEDAHDVYTVSSRAGDERIAELARSFSQTAARIPSTQQHDNPFHSPVPSLDPNSPDFDARKWISALLHAFSKNPDQYPRQPLGVSWRYLGVHGFGSDTDYQKNMMNVLWRAPLIAKEWISSRNQKIQILRDFNGLVNSGELLLVLGRPGSGVSTLLKTIAGQVQGLHLDDRSMLSYQGVPWDVMHSRFRGEVIYQTETDIHFPQLTVGQTLMFAALGRTPNNRLPGVSRKHYARYVRDAVMAVFGISHTINTRVGDDYVRGVSGGERKRVSIAEMMLSQSSIQCWDNSTRGLDSAAALEFARTLRLSSELMGTTGIVAMYQASQAAYDTFDKVTVLYEGRQIYFGPKDRAKQYFIDLGYHCPDRQTTADFLTAMTNPEERIMRSDVENIRAVPRTPDEFAAAWKFSQERLKLINDIATFEGRYPTNGPEHEKLKAAQRSRQASLTRSKSPYTLSVPMQVQLCLSRGFQRLRGDMTFFTITVAANLVIALALGSIYYDLAPTAETLNSKCILLYFAILFNGLSCALEIFSLYVQRPIVEKHYRYALYHPFSEAISSIITELPNKVLSAIFFNIPLYFMTGLRREAGPFFTFFLFSFTCTFTMSMIFRTIAQGSRSIQQALTPAAMLILGLVIYTGFVIPTRSMQGWLRWINYIDPIAYAYESLVANEFSGRKFPCTQFIPMGPAYMDASPEQRACATSGALPGQDFIDGDLYINNLYGYSHSHINFGILVAFVLFFMMCYIAAAEYMSLDPSKGEILVFRQGHAPKSPKSSACDDEESAPAAPVQMEGRATEAEEHPRPVPNTAAAHSDEKDKSDSIFHWSNVCYDITIKGEPRRILDQVDGWVKPGTLTALMGASGAGKTTLLNVLADRVTVGVVTGDMLVNGQLRQKSFQRQTGYVQQQDIHLETATVREALQFSAMLRQAATTSTADKHAYVEEVIELLGMEAYAEAVVGVPGEGLNTEQRKRLTIGVELAAKPDLLLFLDEPTSGLDSQTSWSIALLMKKLSNHGQAILCTIHQPSAMLFQQFDRLLLLAKGGKTVYFGDIGENSKTLTGYFEKHGAIPCGAAENPAEWMLKVIGAAPGAKADRDWNEAWRESIEYKKVQEELKRLEARKTSATNPGKDSDMSSSYATPFYLQVAVCTKRVFQQYWRTPSYLYSKLALSGGMSLFIGVSFYQAELSMSGIQNQMFSIFMLLVIFAFLVYQTMPHFIIQRQQYEGRESASRMYSWQVFILSNIVVELPWTTLASLLIFFPFYYLVGMNNNGIPTDSVTERGGLMFLIIWAFMLFQSTFADMCIAGANTAEEGAIVSLLMFALSLLFCGVMVPRAALPGFWIFMYRVSPITYIVSAMLSAGVARNTVTCSDLELLVFQPRANQTCAQYLESFPVGAVYNPSATENCQYCPMASTDQFLASIDTFYDNRYRDYGLIWAYIVFNVFAAFFVYWLLRVPKKGNWRKMLGI
ncbi:hypothetical protein DHEL01_v203413 [Diaporthe helianthi]|uniref:ABC transporter domain-containing protein n=1 Tax=Diaporthe helianthi TaxID=158607 RepID=A0A2P5I6U6_DIAHE|nr:hypothetical protein DHEL01_v203413 [Diaporthe helianthi]